MQCADLSIRSDDERLEASMSSKEMADELVISSVVDNGVSLGKRPQKGVEGSKDFLNARKSSSRIGRQGELDGNGHKGILSGEEEQGAGSISLGLEGVDLVQVRHVDIMVIHYEQSVLIDSLQTQIRLSSITSKEKHKEGHNSALLRRLLPNLVDSHLPVLALDII